MAKGARSHTGEISGRVIIGREHTMRSVDMTKTMKSKRASRKRVPRRAAV